MRKQTSQKKFVWIPILLAITILVGMFSVVPGVFAQTTSYTVKSTDTLGSIALAHRVTVQSILDANPNIKNPNAIFAGEKLTIPAPNLAPGESIWSGFRSTPTGATPTGATPIPVTGGTTKYTVKATDTLGSIALAHHVTVASLLAANPQIKNPNIVFAGEQLNIPSPNLAPGESIWQSFPSGATAVPVTGATATPVPTTGGAATAQPTQTGMAPTQTPMMGTGTPGSQMVNVSETEFTLSMPTSAAAGMITFNVTNNGTIPHSLEIQGQGIDQKLPSTLNPGQSGTLQVNLTPGTYTVFCPVDNHKGMGMMVTLTVQ